MIDALSPLTVTELNPDGDRGSRETSAFVTVLILFIGLQLTGAFIMMGVMEEKGTKIVELLLSSIHPSEPAHRQGARDQHRRDSPARHPGGGRRDRGVGDRQRRSRSAAIDPRRRPRLLLCRLALLWIALCRRGFVGSQPARCPSHHGPGQLAHHVELHRLDRGRLRSRQLNGSLGLVFPSVSPFAMPARVASGDATAIEVGGALLLALVVTGLVFSLGARSIPRSVIHTDRKLGWREAFRLTT